LRYRRTQVMSHDCAPLTACLCTSSAPLGFGLMTAHCVERAWTIGRKSFFTATPILIPSIVLSLKRDSSICQLKPKGHILIGYLSTTTASCSDVRRADCPKIFYGQ